MKKQEVNVEKAVEMYRKHRTYMERRRVKMILLARKAEAAGITISEKEIDDYIRNRKK